MGNKLRGAGEHTPINPERFETNESGARPPASTLEEARIETVLSPLPEVGEGGGLSKVVQRQRQAKVGGFPGGFAKAKLQHLGFHGTDDV